MIVSILRTWRASQTLPAIVPVTRSFKSNALILAKDNGLISFQGCRIADLQNDNRPSDHGVSCIRQFRSNTVDVREPEVVYFWNKIKNCFGSSKKDKKKGSKKAKKQSCKKKKCGKQKDTCLKKKESCGEKSGEKKECKTTEGKKDDKKEAKKDDPCKKKEEKKEDPCKKKEVKKEEKKDDPCKKKEVKKEEKKEDPCKKKEVKKEEKKDDPCKKKEEKKKEDPCKKVEEKKKEDPCKKKEEKKEDPCKKKEEKKDDPCKKKEEKKDDPCKKKEEKKDDPCKKKEDPCKKKEVKKEDPCKKKEEKKEDPCKKKEVKKEDPCKKKEEKKEDPCKKKEVKKEDPCKKKEEKKEDPCKKKEVKKEDPCKKKEEKKEDPCKKKDEKKDPCKKEEKKADPCKKKEEKKEDPCDPCKKKEEKKEDPCDPCKKKEDSCKKFVPSFLPAQDPFLFFARSNTIGKKEEERCSKPCRDPCAEGACEVIPGQDEPCRVPASWKIKVRPCKRACEPKKVGGCVPTGPCIIDKVEIVEPKLEPESKCDLAKHPCGKKVCPNKCDVKRKTKFSQIEEDSKAAVENLVDLLRYQTQAFYTTHTVNFGNTRGPVPPGRTPDPKTGHGIPSTQSPAPQNYSEKVSGLLEKLKTLWQGSNAKEGRTQQVTSDKSRPQPKTAGRRLYGMMLGGAAVPGDGFSQSISAAVSLESLSAEGDSHIVFMTDDFDSAEDTIPPCPVEPEGLPCPIPKDEGCDDESDEIWSDIDQNWGYEKFPWKSDAIKDERLDVISLKPNDPYANNQL